MVAIQHNIDRGQLDAEISVVVSNKPDADGLVFAKKKGIATQVFEPQNYPDRDAYEADIVTCLQSMQVDLVVLAGYMKLVGDPIILKKSENVMMPIMH